MSPKPVGPQSEKSVGWGRTERGGEEGGMEGGGREGGGKEGERESSLALVPHGSVSFEVSLVYRGHT